MVSSKHHREFNVACRPAPTLSCGRGFGAVLVYTQIRLMDKSIKACWFCQCNPRKISGSIGKCIFHPHSCQNVGEPNSAPYLELRHINGNIVGSEIAYPPIDI